MAASSSSSGGGKKAGDLLKAFPRVSLANLRPNPGATQRDRERGRGKHGGNRSGRGHKGERQRGNRPRLGFEGGQTPFYLVIPKYGFNEGHRSGANLFCAKVNIEVQWASELAIAAVEKNGGVVTTGFYDPRSL
ncbi:hypothetical protein GDO78_012456, partial [Eleutherodactylus coqui]